MATLLPWGTSYGAFSYYKSVTYASAQAGSSSSTNFPICIVLDGTVQAADNDLRTVANGGYVQSASGFDIQPFADSALTTAITYQLIQYAPTTGKVQLCFVQQTLSNSVDGTIYLGFGDASITTDGSSSTTWNNGFVAYYPFPDGSTLKTYDYTPNGNNVNTSATPTAAAGSADGAALWGGSDYMKVLDSNSLDITSNWTIELWFKPTNLTQTNTYLLSKQTTGAGDNIYAVIWEYVNNTVNFYSAPMVAAAFSYPQTGSNISIADTNFHQIVYTWDVLVGGIPYKDGAAVTTAQAGNIMIAQTGDMFIGSYDATTSRVNATLDEIRISSMTRSADWLTAEYNNLKPSSTFLTFGSLTPTTAAAGGDCGPPFCGVIGTNH